MAVESFTTERMQAAGREIRRAWEADEPAQVEGVTLQISWAERPVHYQITDLKNAKELVTVRRVESWLFARPADAQIPCYSVEPRPGCNNRV